MTWTWRTDPQGFVEVERSSAIPTCKEFLADASATGWVRLSLPDSIAHRAAVEKVRQWEGLARPLAQAAGVPPSWVLGFIYAESGGNEKAKLVEPSGAVGVGLMALTAKPEAFPSQWGMTYEQAFEAEPNLKRGIQYMKDLMARGQLDLPELASTYNAGSMSSGKPHPSTVSPWGMREYCGPKSGPPSCCHIERVVRATNTIRAIELAGGPVPPGPLPPPLIGPSSKMGSGMSLLVWAGGATLGWYAIKKWWRRR